MNDISLRNFYAATADVSWMQGATISFASEKAGVNPPPDPPTDAQLANFWIRVELKWRWKYADLMLKGRD